MGTHDILGTVAHHDGGGYVDAVGPGSLLDQAGCRFAAIAAVVRGMGTKEDIVHPSAVRFNGGTHPFKNILENFRFYPPAADNRLIGDDNNPKTGRGQLLQRSETTRQKLELFPGFNIIGGIPVDDTVTI